MKPWVHIVLGVLAAAMVCRQGHSQSPPVRENAYWTQSRSGSIALTSSRRLHISTEGNLTILGKPGIGLLTYSFKTRVRANSQAEAERFRGEFAVTSHVRGNIVFLEVSVPHKRLHSADLLLTVPSDLQQLIVASSGGNVSVSDLDGELRAETAAGQIDLARLRANATLKTGGGEIRIGRVKGGVRCFSAGGNTLLRAAEANPGSRPRAEISK